jgi:hypothetical protein
MGKTKDKLKVKYKRYLVCIIVSISFFKAIGQIDSTEVGLILKPSVTIQLSGGFGLPIGKGYSNSAPEIYSGKSGYLVDLSLSYPIMKSRWGIMIMPCYEINGFDASTFPTGENPVSSGNYVEFNLMGGTYYSLHVQNNLIDFKFLIGPLFFKYPDVIYTEYNMGNPLGLGSYNITLNESQGNALLLSFDIGIGFRHLITQKLILLVNLDFCQSKGVMTQNVQYTNNYNGQESNEVNEGSINIGLLIITFGLGYRIGH